MTSPDGTSLRPDAGVTLVELMVVLVIIAIGILALSGVQTRSSTDVYATGRRTRALAVAQTQLEITRGLDYSLVLADSGLADGFRWVTAVDSEDVALKRITTTASWTEAGTPRSVRLIGLVSQR